MQKQNKYLDVVLRNMYEVKINTTSTLMKLTCRKEHKTIMWVVTLKAESYKYYKRVPMKCYKSLEKSRLLEYEIIGRFNQISSN